jgi:hypothetical protein
MSTCYGNPDICPRLAPERRSAGGGPADVGFIVEARMYPERSERQTTRV